MGDVYHRVSVYPCLKDIYMQGVQFGEAGKSLIESRRHELFVPGMVNICLALEIFLKSINASMECDEDASEIDGAKVYVGRDGSMKISPGGKGHKLSKLFLELPQAARDEISNGVKNEGLRDDVSQILAMYDDVFVDWRYIYEKVGPQKLGTNQLFNIFNVIVKYCEDHYRDTPAVRSELIT